MVGSIMRITALLGAGVTVDIGGIVSNRMTEEVVKAVQTYCDIETQCKVSRKILEEIEIFLNTYYGYKCNFEDIFNALEIIYSLQLAEGNSVNKTPLGAFVNLNPNLKNL